jgi:hypothetical protein
MRLELPPCVALATPLFNLLFDALEADKLPCHLPPVSSAMRICAG